MVLIPVVEAILRKLFNTGIAAPASLVQYLCLVLGMMGGALAARDERLLAFSTIMTVLPDWTRTALRMFSDGIGAAVSGVLAMASWEFVQQERAAGNVIAYGIQRWMIELCMPIGFGLIAVRFLFPILRSAQYSEWNALGLLTGAGSLGLLFPPCLPLILYAIVANVRIQDMFLGGLLPGLLMVLLTAGLGIGLAPRNQSRPTPSCWTEAGQALWDAKWELLLPGVALASLFGGFCTPMEAAALTAFYAFVIEVFVYRDLKLRGAAPRVMTECAVLVGGVFLILGVALGLTDYLIASDAPDRLLEWVKSSIQSPWAFLLVLNLFLILEGCIMDIYTAIIVVAPLIVPLGSAFGLHPVHLGIIFLANLELGFLTPPVGMNLFLASYRFNKPIAEIARSVAPMLWVLFAGVLAITYLPWLCTALLGLIE